MTFVLHLYEAGDENGITVGSVDLTDAAINARFTDVLHGAGSMELVLPRHHASAALLQRDRYGRLETDAGIIDTNGWFLEEGKIGLSSKDEKGGEFITWEGKGSLSILDRGVMDNDSNIAGGKNPIDGFWDLSAQGDFAGASNGHPIPMMKRALVEVELNPPNAIALVDHSSFTYALDSDGSAVPFLDGVFGVDVGNSLYQLAGRLDQLGGFIQRMSDTFVYEMLLAYGTDLTGAFGAGTVRFEKGVNIAVELERRISANVTRTHLVVGGATSTYLTVANPTYTPGDMVRWGYLSVPETDDPGQLTATALNHFAARARASDAYVIPMPAHGDDPANGIYEPNVHFRVGDTVTGHSGTGSHDLNESAQVVAAITWRTKDGEDYVYDVELGSDFHWEEGPTAFGGGNRLCPPFVACADLRAGDLTAEAATNGDAEDTGGGQWFGGAYNTSHYRGGTHGYGVEDAAPSVTIGYSWAGGQVFEAGVRYVCDVWAQIGGSSSPGSTLRVGKLGVDEAVLAFMEEVASPSGSSGGNWARYRGCWTPTADRTGVQLEWLENQTAAGGSDWAILDELALYTAVGEDHGTDPCMTRGDHAHIHGTLSGRSVVDSHPASAVSYDGAVSGLTADDAQAAIDELAAGAAYTDEQAQDAIGAMLADTATVDLTYTDATPALKADVIPAGIKLDDLGAPDDNTDLDASTSSHGLLKKLPGGTTNFLRADGTFAAPPGSGAGGAIAQAYAGYNTVGGSWEQMTARRVYMKKVTLANDCELTNIEAYVDSGALDNQVDSLSFGLFADNAGSPRDIIATNRAPTIGLLMDSVSGSGGNTNGRWFGCGIGKWLIAGDYWIAVSVMESANAGIRIAYDGSGSDRYYDSGGDWWADAGFYTVTTSSNRYSIRANTIR